MTKKCRPQKLKEKCNRWRIYNCPRLADPRNLFHDNTHDIAKTLEKILVVSGISSCKATGARDIILEAFLHYDEIRHGENKIPSSDLSKASVILTLGEKCLMTCSEAQFTYSTMKQLLKAYFQSVPERSIRNYIMEAQQIYYQKFAWDHAARRIVQIFNTFQYVLVPIVNSYRSEIKKIFHDLYNRMKDRIDLIEVPVHGCEASSNINSKLNSGPSCSLLSKSISKSGNLSLKNSVRSAKCPVHMPQNTEHPFEGFPCCLKCNFPTPLCICKIDPRTGKLCFDSSQGPFQCEWYRMDKEHCVKEEDHVCPIDCWDDMSTLNDSYEFCDYESEHYSANISDYVSKESGSVVNVCVEKPETSSSLEYEPFMQGNEYCCHMPFMVNVPGKQMIIQKLTDPSCIRSFTKLNQEKGDLPFECNILRDDTKKTDIDNEGGGTNIGVTGDKTTEPGTGKTNGDQGRKQGDKEPGGQKKGDEGPGGQSTDNKKQGEQEPGGLKQGDRGSDSQKQGEKEPGSEKSGDQGPGGQDPGNQKQGELEPGAYKPGDGKPDDQNIDEQKIEKLETGSESDGNVTKSEKDLLQHGEKPGDEKPDDGKPDDGKPGDGKTGDEKPDDGKTGDEKPGDDKPGDVKPGDEKPGDEKPSDGKSIDEKPRVSGTQSEQQIGETDSNKKSRRSVPDGGSGDRSTDGGSRTSDKTKKDPKRRPGSSPSSEKTTEGSKDPKKVPKGPKDGSGRKKRLPYCPCPPKKKTSKPKKCVCKFREVKILKNRLVPAPSIC